MKTFLHRAARSCGQLGLVLTLLASVATSALGVMQVTNGKLYDSNGTQFIIRGCNAMTLYWDAGGWVSDSDASGDWSKAGDYTFSQLTQTGANTARIFWQYTNGTITVPANALDATIANCIKNNLLPIPELHNVTGDHSVADFNKCIDYWTSAAVVTVLKKYENNIILNLVNEWNVPPSSGSGQPTDADIKNAYGPAIVRIRNAGINCPILLDAGRDYADDENAILNNAAYLKSQDTKNNLMFAVHTYDSASTTRGSQARLKSVMDSMISNQICFIWGEFNAYTGGGAHEDLDWGYLIAYAQTTGTGWLAWAWWDPTDIYSLAYQKQFRAWDNDSVWTKGVCITNGNGIQQTSIKTTSLPQQDPGVPVSNAAVPANPVTIKFAGRSTFFTVDTATDSTGKIQGASILQKAYAGATTQQWNLIKDSSGYYTLVNVGSGKVIEVAGGSTANLANVQQGTDYGRNFQRWSITDAGGGNVHLQSRHAALMPVTESDTTTDGAPVETYAYSGNSFTIASVSGGGTVLVTGVTVNPTSASIAIGGTQQLSSTVSPSNATDQSTTWSSSNTAVATVTNRGLVTGIAAGSATITVTCSSDTSKTATSSITVTSTNVAVTGVSVSPTSTSIAANSTQQLTATVSPSNSTNSAVSWSSNNTSIATVSSNGLVTGVAAGSATITVTTSDGAKTATSAITVTTGGSGGTSIPGKVEAESFTGSATGTTITSNASFSGGKSVSNFGPGNSLTYSVNVITAGTYQIELRAAGPNYGTAKLTFSGNSASATIGTTPTAGYSTFASFYSANITLAAGSQTLTLANQLNYWDVDYINITSAGGGTVTVTGVSVSPTSATIGVNSTQQLTATISPSNATNKAVSWSSSNTAIATVSTSGLVTGVAAGSATITVTTSDGGKTATSAITVSGSVSPIKVEAESFTGSANGTAITSNASFSGGKSVGNFAPGKSLTYSVMVAAAGTYKVELRAAGPNYGTAKLTFSSNSASTTISTTPTAGYSTFASFYSANITLAAGAQTMTLANQLNYWDVDYFTLSYVGP